MCVLVRWKTLLHIYLGTFLTRATLCLGLFGAERYRDSLQNKANVKAQQQDSDANASEPGSVERGGTEQNGTERNRMAYAPHHTDHKEIPHFETHWRTRQCAMCGHREPRVNDILSVSSE